MNHYHPEYASRNALVPPEGAIYSMRAVSKDVACFPAASRKLPHNRKTKIKGETQKLHRLIGYLSRRVCNLLHTRNLSGSFNLKLVPWVSKIHFLPPRQSQIHQTTNSVGWASAHPPQLFSPKQILHIPTPTV